MSNLIFFVLLFFTLAATMSYSYNGVKKKGKEILSANNGLVNSHGWDMHSTSFTNETYKNDPINLTNASSNSTNLTNASNMHILSNDNDLNKISDINAISYKRKGNNMRKNVNKLYQALISEDNREEGVAINGMDELNGTKENENVHSIQKKTQEIEENEEGNVKALKNTENQEKTMNEFVESDIISLIKNIPKNKISKDANTKTDNAINVVNDSKAKIEKEKKEMSTKNKNILDVYGQNEKMKSESTFNLLNFFKNLYQKYTYLNFKEYVDLFFKKYDERVLESISYFNFDEILF